MRHGKPRTIPWLLLALCYADHAPLQAQLPLPASTFDVTAPTASLAEPAESLLPRLDEHALLADYLAYAACNSPALKAAFQRYQGALAQIPQARSLPDPQLTYQYFIKEIETRVGPQRHAVTLSQRFPWFGTLDCQADAAAQTAQAARQQLEVAKFNLFFTVKDAYFEVAYLAQAIAVTNENLALLQQLEEVLLTRYAAATASHPDLVRVQVERGKLDDRLRALQALRLPTAARLNAALNRPITTPIPAPGPVTPSPITLADDEILNLLPQANPALKTLDARIEQHKHLIALAQKDFYPDLTIGLNYVEVGDSTASRRPPDDGKDAIGALLSVNIPLWRNKYHAAVRQSRARYHAAVNDRLHRQNTLAADLQLALFDFHDARRKIDLYANTLLPKAREAFSVTQAAFLTGQSAFTDLIDAQRLLLEFQLALHRAHADHEQSLAQLEMLVATDLTGPISPESGVSQPAPDDG